MHRIYTSPPLMDVKQPTIRPLALVARGLVAVAFISAGIAIYLWLYATRPIPPASDPSATGRLRLVVVAPLEKAVGQRFRAYGQSRAMHTADVPSRVSATVALLHPQYREGAAVEIGTPLVSLDNRDFERQVTMAVESLRTIESQIAMLTLDATSLQRTLELANESAALAAVDYSRVREAFTNNAAQSREVDRARAGAIESERQLIAARDALEKLPLRRASLVAEQSRQNAARELAELSLERSTICSPLAGIVQRADLELGENAAPGVLVARIVDPRTIEIPILLPALARAIVQIGDSALVRADRANAQWVEAKITRIAPEDDASTRTMTVYAEALGSDALPPGAFVEAEVSGGSLASRTLVPRRAVNSGRIITVRDGIAHNESAEVEFAVSGQLSPQLPDTEWVVLKHALPAGTRLVLDASRRVPEGAPITPIDAAL